MLKRIGRLFVIKTRWEAWVVIYALALGAVDRGSHYLERFPGVGGWLLFAACTGVIFVAGAKLLDATRPDSGERRRRTDPSPESVPYGRNRRRAARPLAASGGRGGFMLQEEREPSRTGSSHKRLVEGARLVS